MVYAAVSEATLAVRVAILVVSFALFLMSCASVVRSLVTAAARLSRYPSSRADVSGAIVGSLSPVTAFANPVEDVAPAAKICHLQAMWAAR